MVRGIYYIRSEKRTYYEDSEGDILRRKRGGSPISNTPTLSDTLVESPEPFPQSIERHVYAPLQSQGLGARG